jgi:hypothetical protein
MDDYIYFDKSHKDYKLIIKLIIEQGNIICRGEFDNSVIKNSIEKLEYGYIHIQQKAQIGQMKNKKKEFIGYSFIICTKKMDIPFITLICARQNTKDGVKLLQLVEEKSINEGYKYIALHSIIEINLINWYKKQGFVIEDEIFIDYYDKKKPKVYLMSKKLL